MNLENLEFVGPVAEIRITIGDIKTEDGKTMACVIFQGCRTTMVMGIPSVEEFGPLTSEAFAAKALHMTAGARANTEAKPTGLLVAKPGTRLN